MAFKLVSSGGNVTDPAVVNMRCSGTIHPGDVVVFSRTAGAGVAPAGMSSTITEIFGIAWDYTQGVGDSYSVRVTPFAPGQIWEADCANAAATTQVGLRHGFATSGGDGSAGRAQTIHNTAADATTATAIFRCIAISSALTGSGKILGYFRRGDEAGVGTISAPYETTAY